MSHMPSIISHVVFLLILKTQQVKYDLYFTHKETKAALSYITNEWQTKFQYRYFWNQSQCSYILKGVPLGIQLYIFEAFEIIEIYYINKVAF